MINDPKIYAYCLLAVGKDEPVKLILENGKVTGVENGLPEIKWVGLTVEQIENLRKVNNWGLVFYVE